MVDREFFEACLKALRVSEKMDKQSYVRCKTNILAECSSLGDGAINFVHEFFKLADERRACVDEIS